MKLLTFIEGDSFRLGVKTKQGIIDVLAAIEQYPPNYKVPVTIDGVLVEGKSALDALKQFIDNLITSGLVNDFLVEEKVLSFAPCIPNPGKIICVGLNYRKHAEETNSKIPEYPILFNKFNNTLTGHGAEVLLPTYVTKRVDYEAELAIVIGEQIKCVDRENTLNYVFGYCNVNDLSARDLQMRTSQWLLGKSCDGFLPLGPYLVTADEVGDPNNLTISCWVNGELRQHSNTSDMIFHCDQIISYISQYMTLEPGDIILTGTPEGVVLGYPEDKQIYLQDGDIVTVEIEKLGKLSNRLAAKSDN